MKTIDLRSILKRVERDPVGGGWTVETRRGFFTFPTLRRTLREAWMAR